MAREVSNYERARNAQEESIRKRNDGDYTDAMHMAALAQSAASLAIAYELRMLREMLRGES